MAQIRADEISRVLREEIENYEGSIDISETGSVISVGDGIARVYGLEKVMAGALLQGPPRGARTALKTGQDTGGAARPAEYTVNPQDAPGRRPARPTSRL